MRNRAKGTEVRRKYIDVFMFSGNSSSNLNLNHGYRIENCLFIYKRKQKKNQNTRNELKEQKESNKNFKLCLKLM